MHVACLQPLEILLEYLAALNTINNSARICKPSCFYSSVVSSLPDDRLKGHYIRMLQNRISGADALTLCKYPFVFDADAKRRILHLDLQSRQSMVWSEYGM